MNHLTIQDASLFKTYGKWFLRLLIKQDCFKSTNIMLFPKVSIPLEDLVLEPVQTFEGFEYRLALPWNKLIPYKDDETGKKLVMAIVKKEPDIIDDISDEEVNQVLDETLRKPLLDYAKTHAICGEGEKPDGTN